MLTAGDKAGLIVQDTEKPVVSANIRSAFRIARTSAMRRSRADLLPCRHPSCGFRLDDLENAVFGTAEMHAVRTAADVPCFAVQLCHQTRGVRLPSEDLQICPVSSA